MATIVNQSRYLVTVKRRPDLAREFPHSKAAAATAYKDQVLRDHGLKAEIERGPLQLLVRLRAQGQPKQSKRVKSYEEAEAFELGAQVDQHRGLALDYNRSHRVTMAALMERYITEVCVEHKGEDIEVGTLKGMLADSRGELTAAREAFKQAQARGEKPKPVRARRQARNHLEWLHLPFADVRSQHLTTYKIGRLRQVAPATVDRELDLFAAVIHTAIDSWDYAVPKDPMKGVSRPKYDNERDRRFEGDEQECLFRSARREDLIRSRNLAIESLLDEARRHAKTLPTASARQRFLKQARGQAVRQLNRRYPVVPLYESLLALLLETAGRRGAMAR